MEFRDLPFVARLAVAVTFFNAWVLFAEVVIDRNGWAVYMPYYRVGQLCAWDVGALLLIVWLVFHVASGRRRRQALAGNPPA